MLCMCLNPMFVCLSHRCGCYPDNDIREPPWLGSSPPSCCHIGRQEHPPSLDLLGAAALWRGGNFSVSGASLELLGWGHPPHGPPSVLLPSRVLPSVPDILGYSAASLGPLGSAWGYLGVTSGSFCSNYAGSSGAFFSESALAIIGCIHWSLL